MPQPPVVPPELVALLHDEIIQSVVSLVVTLALLSVAVLSASMISWVVIRNALIFLTLVSGVYAIFLRLESLFVALAIADGFKIVLVIGALGIGVSAIAAVVAIAIVMTVHYVRRSAAFSP